MEPRLNKIWPQTGLRPASKLDSVMEFGRQHAPKQFGASSVLAPNQLRTSSKQAPNRLRTGSEPAPN